MRRSIILAVGGLFLIFTAPVWGMDEILLNVIQRLAEEEIVVWAKDPIIVNAIKEANKKAIMSQEEIDRLDKKWRITKGANEMAASFLNNECAVRLKKFQNKQRGERILYPEIFVMDHHGLIVAETDITSDYWRGDEDKFIKSFAQGKGSLFIDELTYDESTRVHSIQVSVPIFDPNTGKAIGAMTVGIGLDALTEHLLDL